MSRDRSRPVPLLLSVLSAVVLALASLAVLSPGPASGGAVKGSLVVISVNDAATGLAGAVQGRPFSVVVEARDEANLPLLVTKDTPVALSKVSGPGTLSGVVTGVIKKNTARATISGALFSTFANGVVFEVRTTGGVALSPGQATANVARTAVRASASPGSALDVTDPTCAAPSAAVPVCGYLKLPNGANGQILLSVGSCAGILSCFTGAAAPPGLVTASVSLKDAAGNPLYTPAAPATFVVACDKTLCGNGGVPKFDVLIDVTDSGAFAVAPPCPSKGVLGNDQTFCLDTVQSKRDGAGDLYSVILFDHDIRGSYP